MDAHPTSDRSARRGARRDRGQAAIVVVTVTAVLMVAIMVGLATMGRNVVTRQRAQTAADAAALASVDGTAADAATFAAHHGATVVSWSQGPGPHEVTVTVAIDGITATARASNAP